MSQVDSGNRVGYSYTCVVSRSVLHDINSQGPCDTTQSSSPHIAEGFQCMFCSSTLVCFVSLHVGILCIYVVCIGPSRVADCSTSLEHRHLGDIVSADGQQEDEEVHCQCA